MPGMPRVLKNFTVFINGSHEGTVVKSVTLPVLERKMEEVRTGPMLGPVKVPLGLNAMSMEITAAEENVAALSAWASTSHSGTIWRFASAHSSDSAEDTQAIGILARGKMSKVDFGSAEAGNLKESKYTLELSLYSRLVNGLEQIYIDMINGIERVNGVNISAPYIAALGLSTQ